MPDIVVGFFLLGWLAFLLKVDLRLPSAIYEFLTLVLLISIGIKGGMQLHAEASTSLLWQSLLILALGVVLALLAFAVLRAFSPFSRSDMAALAAHYGSVSVGTFAVALAFMDARNIYYESYLSLFVAILEVPAILVGLLLARGKGAFDTGWQRRLFAHKSLVLLLGALLLGAAYGSQAQGFKDALSELFSIALALYLMHLGAMASSSFSKSRQQSTFLIAFALLMPLLGAAIAIPLGIAMGLSLGGVAIMAALAASASYIAVPAVLESALPDADLGKCMTASLAITFPFNVLLGIPLYFHFSEQLLS